MDLLKYIRWPYGCLIFLFSCTSSASYNEFVLTADDSIINEHRMIRASDSIGKMKTLLQSGDLVTRTGNDFTSFTFRSMGRRDKTYSHCGLASIENDTVFVYHALGGEWNPDQKILREPFEKFVEPYNNLGNGIFRFALNSKEISSIVNQVKDYYSRQIMFDLDFDLKTDERMYCAEFVVKSIMNGTKGTISFNPSVVRGIQYYTVDDIFLHPACIKVAQVVYK